MAVVSSTPPHVVEDLLGVIQLFRDSSSQLSRLHTLLFPWRRILFRLSDVAPLPQLLLVSPFFGGTVRTKSEAEQRPTDKVFVNLDLLDRLWRLSLPVGMNRDHPWANPFGPSSPELDSVELDPMLVMAGGDEVMKDRIQDYYKRLKAKNKEIEYVEFEGEEHGVFVNQPVSDVADKAIQRINQFMSKN